MMTDQVRRAEVMLADPFLFGRVMWRPLRGPGQDGDHGAGESAAEDQLVEEVRDLVGRDVGGTQASGADRL